MVKLRVAAVVMLGAVAGCLEGDPNPVTQPGTFTGSSGSSGTSGSGTIQPNACSGTSSTAATLLFNNRSSRPLRVLWVNQQCTEVDYGALETGAIKVQPTFVSHVWRVRDAETSALYKEFTTTTQGTTEVDIP